MTAKINYCWPNKIIFRNGLTKHTNYSWLQINKDSSGDVFAGTSLTEEGIERVITTSNCLVTWHLSIRLDAMLQTVQLPAGIAHLDTSLTYMDGDTLTLEKERIDTQLTCEETG